MINLIIFILSFCSWLYLMIDNKGHKWCAYALSVIWGAFFAQTIMWVCGVPTLIK